MLFNSVQYVLFLPICIVGYYLLPCKIRNRFLLFVSYFFYMCWNPYYILLLFFSTIVTWFCGFGIAKSQKGILQKAVLCGTIIVNISILFLFKYYNFFWDITSAIFAKVGIILSVPKLSLLLPVGISFYVFQALGYAIDVYRGEIEPERDLFDYALFVSFFPQLVAGPIERSKNLLPQFKVEHKFDIEAVIAGLRLILLGMVKKIVLADMAALYVDAVYADIENFSGLTMLVATFLFSIQIYGDFAGYSDVARGTAMTLGFHLMENFSAPYFSTSIREFWQRWHISLSTWLKDYIYIPLGGNRKGFFRKCLNLLVIFGISGLWHGADMTFLYWGGVHGACRVVEECVEQAAMKVNWKRQLPKTVYLIVSTFLCFAVVQFAWIFFRANSVLEAKLVIEKILSGWDIQVFLLESSAMIGEFMPDYIWMKNVYVIILLIVILWMYILIIIKNIKIWII